MGTEHCGLSRLNSVECRFLRFHKFHSNPRKFHRLRLYWNMAWFLRFLILA